MSMSRATVAPPNTPRVVRKAKIVLITARIAVTPDTILFDDKSVCTTKELLHLSVDDIEKHYIEKQFHPVLTKLDRAFDELKSNVGSACFLNEAILQIDRSMYMGVVHNLMRSCGMNGFNNIKFAVLARDE